MLWPAGSNTRIVLTSFSLAGSKFIPTQIADSAISDEQSLCLHHRCTDVSTSCMHSPVRFSTVASFPSHPNIENLGMGSGNEAMSAA